MYERRPSDDGMYIFMKHHLPTGMCKSFDSPHRLKETWVLIMKPNGLIYSRYGCGVYA